MRASMPTWPTAHTDRQPMLYRMVAMPFMHQTWRIWCGLYWCDGGTLIGRCFLTCMRLLNSPHVHRLSQPCVRSWNSQPGMCASSASSSSLSVIGCLSVRFLSKTLPYSGGVWRSLCELRMVQPIRWPCSYQQSDVDCHPSHAFGACPVRRASFEEPAPGRFPNGSQSRGPVSVS